jgi:ABC-type Fe3+-hydroxamate transport system substrate-binding protein
MSDQMDNRQARVNRRMIVAGAGLALGALGAGRTLPALAQGTPEASPSVSPVTSGTRVVSHAMGETEVPADPQRVVVLDGPVLDACFALGVTPVGATTGVADAPSGRARRESPTWATSPSRTWKRSPRWSRT